MNNIKVAMTVNGEIIESGDTIRVIDDAGNVHEGRFIRTFPHAQRPDLMRVRYYEGKEKKDVIGTTAKEIKKISKSSGRG